MGNGVSKKKMGVLYISHESKVGDQQVKTSLLPLLADDHKKEPDRKKTRKDSFKVS